MRSFGLSQAESFRANVALVGFGLGPVLMKIKDRPKHRIIPVMRVR